MPAMDPETAQLHVGACNLVVTQAGNEKTALRRFCRNALNLLVGDAGFEPATSTSRT